MRGNRRELRLFMSCGEMPSLRSGTSPQRSGDYTLVALVPTALRTTRDLQNYKKFTRFARIFCNFANPRSVSGNGRTTAPPTKERLTKKNKQQYVKTKC